MMKLILPTVAASLAIISSSSAALIAHYNLDETTGTVANDSSGNGNHMNWNGTVGTPDWQAAGGVAGGAFNFTGLNDDSFMTSTFALSPSTPLTMSVWVNTASTANDTLVYVGDGGTNSSYYTTKIQSGQARVVARNTTQIQNGVATVNDSTWRHITSVYVSDSERNVYVDGVFQNTNTTLVPAVTLNRIGIGALTRGTGPVDEYAGLLDDVQIYDQALTQTQITFLAANPGATVPEPSAAILLVAACGAGLLRRRRA